jgi:Uncharacterized protein conserved in bacteria (DUF2252)
LKSFLEEVDSDNSAGKQLEKFTQVDKSSGNRVFLKGTDASTPDPYTKLAPVTPKYHKMIVDAFTRTKYGATMMKLGWQVHEWSDDFFTVLDVAQRVGSGVGSFGVDRFYVLVKVRPCCTICCWTRTQLIPGQESLCPSSLLSLMVIDRL